MIQITPQMRIVAAIEPVDFRCGIDGLARLVQGRAETRSVQRLGVRVSQSVGEGAEDPGLRRAGILALPQAAFQRASSAGGRPARTRRPRRWRPIRCRCFSRRAIPRPRKPRRRGGRLGRRIEAAPVRDPAAASRIASNCSCVFPESVLWCVCAKRTSGSACDASSSFAAFARAWPFSRAAVAGIIMPTQTDDHRVGHGEAGRDPAACRGPRPPRGRLRDDPHGDRILCRSVLTRWATRTRRIARLRKMLFGAQTEKTAAVVGQAAGSAAPCRPDAQLAAASDGGTSPRRATRANPRRSRGTAKNHGRNGADAYTGAEKIEVRHESLQPGDPCPKCEEGTVYETNRPGVLVRLVGQAPVGAKVYYLQKLRCNLCGVVFTAEPPAGMGTEEVRCDGRQHDRPAEVRQRDAFPSCGETAREPGHSLASLDAVGHCRVLAEHVEPVFEELVQEAAQGDVLSQRRHHGQDSGADGRASPTSGLWPKSPEPQNAADVPAKGAAKKAASERTGLFTSGDRVDARGAANRVVPQRAATCRGESQGCVGAERAAELAPPIQMCDALSRNDAGGAEDDPGQLPGPWRGGSSWRWLTVFPKSAATCWSRLAVVYRNDALARQRNLSPQERLLFHQAESGPTMEELRVWLVRAVRRAAGRAQLGVGRSHFVPAETLGEAHAVSSSGRCPAGQQYLRAGVEEGDSASQERPVLQDSATGPMSATCS